MRRFRPIHGVFVVLVFMATILGANWALQGHAKDFERVSPDRSGIVRIPVGDLKPLQVRFYRFLNSGNQEVKFFVARDNGGDVQVAFDASEVCAKFKGRAGFRKEGEWVACNKCDKSFRISEVNAGGGGCKPVPLAHRVEGGTLVIAQADILTGWRLFR
jgi:uncharacterized membrane protein